MGKEGDLLQNKKREKSPVDVRGGFCVEKQAAIFEEALNFGIDQYQYLPHAANSGPIFNMFCRDSVGFDSVSEAVGSKVFGFVCCWVLVDSEVFQ